MSKDDKDFAIRSVYIDTIKRMKADIDANVDGYSYFALDERQKKIQSDLHKFEAKNVQIACAGTGNDFNAAAFGVENDEISRLCLDLKAEIRMKMNELERREKCAIQAEIAPTKANIGSSESLGNDLASIELDKKSDTAVKKSSECKLQSSAVESTRVNEATELANSLLAFDIGNWNEFEKEFTEKVEKSDKLKDEEKLALLFRKCAGTRAEVVLAQLNENDYTAAFESLRKSYGTAYGQVEFFTKNLMRLPALTNPNAMEFMSMVKGVDYCIEGMKRHLNANFDQVITFLVIDKLDKNTRLQWERHRKVLAASCTQSGNEYTPLSFVPDWQSLKSFLRDEAELCLQYGGSGSFEAGTDKSQSYEALADRSGIQRASPVRANLTPYNHRNQKRVNNHCDCTDRHPIHKCGAILCMNLEERKAYMIEERVCMQCLWRAHPGSDCVDPLANRFCSRCAPDKIKHNSLLCPVSYGRAQQKLAVVTPQNSMPNWHSSNDNDENW